MNTPTLHRRLSPQEYAALMDEAKWRAIELRREAIDEFWSGAADSLRRFFGKAPTVRVGNPGVSTTPLGKSDRPGARSVSY